MKSITLEPTPAGYRHMVRIFKDQIERSRTLIKEAEATLEGLNDDNENAPAYIRDMPSAVCELMAKGLEALCEVEASRIVAMESGIAEVGNAGGEKK